MQEKMQAATLLNSMKTHVGSKIRKEVAQILNRVSDLSVTHMASLLTTLPHSKSRPVVSDLRLACVYDCNYQRLCILICGLRSVHTSGTPSPAECSSPTGKTLVILISMAKAYDLCSDLSHLSAISNQGNWLFPQVIAGTSGRNRGAFQCECPWQLSRSLCVRGSRDVGLQTQHHVQLSLFQHPLQRSSYTAKPGLRRRRP